MSVIDTLVYDRTQADVDRVLELNQKGISGMTTEELAEYLAGMKGAYNAADLNRVGQALLFLQNQLNSYGYAVTVSMKTNWTRTDAPTLAQLTSYLTQVGKIRSVLEVFSDTPAVPSTMNKLTWEDANKIEKILWDVQRVIDQIVAGFWQSNAFTMWSGSVHLPSSKNDIGRNWKELDAMDTGWRNWQLADWYLLLYGNLQEEADV